VESLPSWEGEILSIFLGDYESPRKPEIKVLVPFSSRSGCPGAVAAASLDLPGLFPCLEEGCVKMFSTYEELQHHLDTECHLIECQLTKTKFFVANENIL